jgi:putative ATP-binding cassette transporter
VFFSLNVVVARFSELTSFGAGIDRLYSFAEALNAEALNAEALNAEALKPKSLTPVEGEAVESAQPRVNQPTIAIAAANSLALTHFTLQTPNYQRTLVKDLSTQVPDHTGLLIVGPSGCGKSSLLRAIAGLWQSGSGTIHRPPLDQILFLPQKPYMILGTLRDQLTYPNTGQTIDDAGLKDLLEKVNLADLDQRFGGFDAVEAWGDVLSLGEQQRLTFARILLNQPDFAILDEATSALDLANEARLYDHLRHTGTTFIIVGHRESLHEYHQNTLKLGEDHTWALSIPGVAPADS